MVGLRVGQWSDVHGEETWGRIEGCSSSSERNGCGVRSGDVQERAVKGPVGNWSMHRGAEKGRCGGVEDWATF